MQLVVVAVVDMLLVVVVVDMLLVIVEVIGVQALSLLPAHSFLVLELTLLVLQMSPVLLMMIRPASPVKPCFSILMFVLLVVVSKV